MFTIAFVAHGGELETKAALLACSLKQKCHPEIKRIAVIIEPTKRWGQISAEAEKVLEETGTEIVFSSNIVDESYPHGNKINSLNSIQNEALFLDSDTMMMRPFLTHYSLLDGDAAAKPAEFNTFEQGGGDWKPVYDLFDLDLPKTKILSTISREAMLPYYNAGFIYVKEGSVFSETWVETARRIDQSTKIQNKRPWLDQIALPIVFQRLNWSVSEANVDLNFPGHVQKLNGHVPYILHYHRPLKILEEPRVAQDVLLYISKYEKLKKLMIKYREWNMLLKGLDNNNFVAFFKRLIIRN